ncbi:two-component system, OmpR family, sensor kinase/two-component system, OmpR family, sensor histidine kinase QseC [Variovorax sp. YR634]|jgi:two-component system OmpR family sensor kinase/two-component system sensor histidine kinase QseC|uniref:sensor histidine kinase n=1 Tax=unclassified Variovorax TaxID=663243 RepID=UPI00089C4389|nr:ATP-binding protein [Variovorax sp. YR634]SDY54927.1 two-component system, OmpR family, sensor kinase/two-component system, OmpR family, sensor histidine kinase QseC [Variovorax sp. YR634]
MTAAPGRPWYSPSSLRNRLLMWLVVVHLLAAAGVAWFTYASYDRLIVTFKDDQMQMLADSYASNVAVPELRPADERSIFGRGAFVIQIWNGRGELLVSSWPALAVARQPAEGLSTVRMGSGDDGVWRIYSTAPVADADRFQVQVIQNGGFVRRLVAKRALSSTAPIALLLPLSLAVLWLVVWASSRKLRSVVLDVAAQDERSLSELSVSRVPDEIAPLVEAFNSLLGRLRQAFAAQRRFVQDAAHELRTPIAAIGLQLDNMRAEVPAESIAEHYTHLKGGVTRAQHLIEQLLRLSRQESSTEPEAPESLDVASVLRDSVAQLMVVADRRRIDIGFEGETSATVTAPPAELRSVFDNLIDNALRHSPEGGVVDVRLHEVEGRPVVDVLDNGPGIPPELIDRAFDRFFRVPGNPTEGSGLGLAIARMAALRNGLRIVLANRHDAQGRPAGLQARVHLRDHLRDHGVGRAA